MSLVLSKAFSGLLLSSYVIVKFDLAVKSFQDLIDNPSIEIIHDNCSLRFIEHKTPELIKLMKRPFLYPTKNVILANDKDIAKLRNGKSVILCNSINCPLYIATNPHIKLVYTVYHLFHSFGCLRIKKAHSHAKPIHKL